MGLPVHLVAISHSRGLQSRAATGDTIRPLGFMLLIVLALVPQARANYRYCVTPLVMGGTCERLEIASAFDYIMLRGDGRPDKLYVDLKLRESQALIRNVQVQITDFELSEHLVQLTGRIWRVGLAEDSTWIEFESEELPFHLTLPIDEKGELASSGEMRLGQDTFAVTAFPIPDKRWQRGCIQRVFNPLLAEIPLVRAKANVPKVRVNALKESLLRGLKIPPREKWN